jgi:hypothetical protein
MQELAQTNTERGGRQIGKAFKDGWNIMYRANAALEIMDAA